jgi:putative salt-induced outer membrane protein YdiY
LPGTLRAKNGRRIVIRRILQGLFVAIFFVSALCADDWLEFNNGESVVGHYVKTENSIIFFQSSRFGLLKVSVNDAHVVTGSVTTPAAPPVTPATVKVTPATATSKPPPSTTTAAPPAMAAAQRRKWKGRIDVLLDYVWDVIDNQETRVQLNAERLSGKEHYVVYGNIDYLYNNHLLQQDRREGTFTWEHQLTDKLYSIAEPDYLHEIRQSSVNQYQMRVGIGAKLFQTDRSQVRVAVLSYFSRLDIPAVDRRVENVYPAVRLDSKWQIFHGLKFEQEGTAYYIPNGGEGGVDNKVSLTKDIFGGITLTLQHEYHHEEIPNASATRNELKLLLGYTF